MNISCYWSVSYNVFLLTEHKIYLTAFLTILIYNVSRRAQEEHTYSNRKNTKSLTKFDQTFEERQRQKTVQQYWRSAKLCS